MNSTLDKCSMSRSSVPRHEVDALRARLSDLQRRRSASRSPLSNSPPTPAVRGDSGTACGAVAYFWP